MALFDNYQQQVINATETLFGDVATWLSSEGAILYEGLVYFASPEKVDTLGDTVVSQYSPLDVHIEFYTNQFVGLKALVDSGEFEHIRIKGVDYWAKSVSPIKDGKTFIATLQHKKA